MENEIDFTDQPSEVSDLVIRIMQQNAKDAAYTSNALVASYKQRAEELDEEISAIRHRIKQLFATGYQPTESAIMDALYPYS